MQLTCCNQNADTVRMAARKVRQGRWLLRLIAQPPCCCDTLVLLSSPRPKYSATSAKPSGAERNCLKNESCQRGRVGGGGQGGMQRVWRHRQRTLFGREPLRSQACRQPSMVDQPPQHTLSAAEARFERRSSCALRCSAAHSGQEAEASPTSPSVRRLNEWPHRKWTAGDGGGELARGWGVGGVG